MKTKKYTEVQRARMLYTTYKNRLREQPNAFTLIYTEEAFHKFSQMIFTYYDKPCRYCGDTLTIANISLDHIVPIARGGSSSIENLECVCKRCNRRKGDLTREEYNVLLEFLEGYPQIRDNVLKRLSQAGFMFYKR